MNRERFTQSLDQFCAGKIMCVGDVMLDRYFYGNVTRISPEAPVPIMRADHIDAMLGGAANVARNITAMDGQCSLFSAIGSDPTGNEILALLKQESRIIPFIEIEKERASISKIRYIGNEQHLLRVDHERITKIRGDSSSRMLRSIAEELDNYSTLVISDYGKGVLNEELSSAIVKVARDKSCIIIVDSKSKNLMPYDGAYIITPNFHEFCEIAGRILVNDSEMGVAAEQIMHKYNITWILVTRGKDGMTLFGVDGEMHHIQSRANEVYDVSGAGDTVVAALALGISAGLKVPEAAYLANIAAGIAVGRVGTAAVSIQDLRLALIADQRIGGIQKIMPLSEAAERVSQWKRAGKRIGFTNGCFDLLHGGHLNFLHSAREQCDKLVVAINDDESVKMLKGIGRPVQNELDRALMMASLSTVDLVVLFGGATPTYVIKNLKPEVMFKGSDYRKEDIAGADIVEANGGYIVILPRSEGYSTSQLIEKARNVELIVNH